MLKKALFICFSIIFSSVFINKSYADPIVTITEDSLFMMTKAGFQTDPSSLDFNTYYGPSWTVDGSEIKIGSHAYNDTSEEPLGDTYFGDSVRIWYSGNNISITSISDDWVTDYALGGFSDSYVYLCLGFTVEGDDISLHLGGTGQHGSQDSTRKNGYSLYLYDQTSGNVAAENIFSGTLALVDSHTYNLYFNLFNIGYSNDMAGETSATISFRNAELRYDVPEPSSLLLFGSGLFGLVVFMKKFDK